jgi:hypothetical protein
MLAWDAAATRWIDDETGRAVSMAAVIAARDALADGYAAQFRALALLFTSGALTASAWTELFTGLLMEAITHGYSFGRGGLDRLDDTDWQRITDIYRRQLDYATNFITEVEERIEDRPAGVTAAEALDAAAPSTAARAELYAGSVVESYEQGQVAAVSEGRGVLRMPVYPADGGTECRSRCRCAWSIVADDQARQWCSRWITESDPDVCDGCRERGRRYARLDIPME